LARLGDIRNRIILYGFY